MRIRSIKPEFWVSESMGRLQRDHRLLFIGLWSVADDHGRFRADPRYLAGQLFPYDLDGLEVVSRGLARLREEGCVELYMVAGSHYGALPGWKTHQRIDKPSNRTSIPQPSELSTVEKSREGSSTPRNSSSGEQGTGNREQGEEQGTGRPPPQQVARAPSSQIDPPEGRLDSGRAYLAWLQQQRLAGGVLPDTNVHPQAFDRWFSEVMLELNGDGDRIDATVARFSADPYWRKEGLPLRALVKRWRDFVPPAAPRTMECVACRSPGATGWPELGLPTCYTHFDEALAFSNERGLVVFEGGAQAWAATLSVGAKS